MDIHPPKHPIVSVRTFLIELFTVTCGIVIALGLEGLIVAHHEAGLRRQAEREFRAEIAANRSRLDTVLKAEPTASAMIETLLAYGTERLAHHPASLPKDLTITRSFSLLPNDAWQTALATQAIGQLSFDEVRGLSALQDGVVVFNDFETRAREQWIGIAAFGDPATLTDDEVRVALQSVRIAYAYQRSIATLAHDLLGKADAASRALGAGD